MLLGFLFFFFSIYFFFYFHCHLKKDIVASLEENVPYYHRVITAPFGSICMLSELCGYLQMKHFRTASTSELLMYHSPSIHPPKYHSVAVNYCHTYSEEILEIWVL